MKSPLRALFRPGSNPRDSSGLIHSSPFNWIVIPWQEYPEGSRIGLYHFRLDLCVENSGGRSLPLDLEVRWPHPSKLVGKLLDFAYVLHPDGRLGRTEGRVEHSSCHLRLKLAPGRSWISTNPAWHTSQNDAWFRDLRRAGARTRILGTTPQGRPIRAAEFGQGSQTALIVARMHPYESASSYSAAGIAEWLQRAGPAARQALEKWRVTIVPIANPDGVASGCTRLTGEDGADLNIDALEHGDPTALILKSRIDTLRPDLFLNFHNWMGKTTNGVFYFEKPELWAFLRAFDDMFWEKRTWLALQVGSDLRPGDPIRQALDRHCRNTFGTLSYVLEFPWHGSTLAGARRSGVRAFQAAIKAFAELRE